MAKGDDIAKTPQCKGGGRGVDVGRGLWYEPLTRVKCMTGFCGTIFISHVSPEKVFT